LTDTSLYIYVWDWYVVLKRRELTANQPCVSLQKSEDLIVEVLFESTHFLGNVT